MHGLLATTMPVGPVLIVNGPIRRAIGMNAGINVFGQGNRANATIGRALQLVIRNVGGGRPGEVDRATFGNPGKLGFCFAEDEEGSPWTPLSADLGCRAGHQHGDAVPGRGAAQHRRPALARSRVARAHLRGVSAHACTTRSCCSLFDAILAVGPEHARVFREAGWDKQQLHRAPARAARMLPGAEIVRGAGGIAEGAARAVRGRDAAEVPAGGAARSCTAVAARDSSRR